MTSAVFVIDHKPNLLCRTLMRTIACLPKCSQQLVQQTGAAAEADPRLVRAALPLLLEDPPLTLGKSQLAICLLPELAERYRGQLLQRALLSAIERLRPSQGTMSDNHRRWPYLICRAEYVEGNCRREVESRLAISASTYTRGKRQALGRIAALLPIIIVELSDPSISARNWPALLAHLHLMLDIASVHVPHPAADQHEQQLVARMLDLQQALYQVLIPYALMSNNPSIQLPLQQYDYYQGGRH
jgi:hypothetical protein